MLSWFRRRLNHPLAVAYLALFVALGGGALAATGGFTGSDGRIHGCVSKKGQLKVLKPPKTNCGAHQAQIAWNQHGVAGKNGHNGTPGAKGERGPGAVKINASSSSPNTVPIAVVGPWTIGMSCLVDPHSDVSGGFYVKGPGNAEYSVVDSDDDSNHTPSSGGPALSPTSFTSIFPDAVTDQHYGRVIGSMILSDGTSVATLTLNFLADARGPDTSKWGCSARGSATPTT